MAGTSRRIVIFGGSAYREEDSACVAAAELGMEIARRGWVLVNGGYGGTMLASAQAARAAGGRVIGVSCSIFKSAPNAHLTDVEATENLFDRLRRLIELGDAYICLPGSTGTLAELALVWELMNKHLLPRRPLLCWGDFWGPVVGIFGRDTVQDPRIQALGNLRERRGELITFVHDAPGAMAALDRAFAEDETAEKSRGIFETNDRLDVCDPGAGD